MVGRGQKPGGSLKIARPKIPPPETNPWYWHPFRPTSQFGPSWFTKKLKEFDPELEITWTPIQKKWLIWARKERIQSPICWGWALLFLVDPDKLDERVFARLYASSVRKWSSGREYFSAVQREIERDKERADRAATQDAIDRAMPTFEHSQISVSMFGKSSGSKFSTYHS